MKDRIEINFDKSINGYVVTMPDFITLDMIEAWKDRFDQVLKETRNLHGFQLLFDSNTHNFESIHCLKCLRDYFTDNEDLLSNFSRVAFVAPAKYVTPQIKSEGEAYFDNLEQAYKWLKE